MDLDHNILKNMDQKESNMYVPTYNILINNHHVYIYLLGYRTL